MAMITVRNLDPEVIRKLKLRAAENGNSMEAEARLILQEAIATTEEPFDFVKEFRSHFKGVFLPDDFELPERLKETPPESIFNDFDPDEFK